MATPPSDKLPAIAIPPEPTIKFKPQKVWATVKEVEDLTDTISFVRFKIDGGVFDFQPGQFVSLFVDKEGKSVSRPYSIASPPENKEYLEICIRKVPAGFMSNHLTGLKPGAQVRMQGPLGRFILIEPVANDIVLIATGTGVAPFISMLGHVFRKDSDVDQARQFWLFLGVRYVTEMMYRDYLEEMSRNHPNFHMVWVISRPETPEWKGRVGHVQDFLRREIGEAKGKHVYICGLRHMLEETKPICEEMGFSVVRFEKWD